MLSALAFFWIGAECKAELGANVEQSSSEIETEVSSSDQVWTSTLGSGPGPRQYRAGLNL